MRADRTLKFKEMYYKVIEPGIVYIHKVSSKSIITIGCDSVVGEYIISLDKVPDPNRVAQIRTQPTATYDEYKAFINQVEHIIYS